MAVASWNRYGPPQRLPRAPEAYQRQNEQETRDEIARAIRRADARIATAADDIVTITGRVDVIETEVDALSAVDLLSLTFTQDGTDAVSRTALDKLRERVTPEDYGAVGDGSTDDRHAFLKAITYLSIRGGQLWLGRNRYALSGVIEIAANGVTIEGASRGQNNARGAELISLTGDHDIIRWSQVTATANGGIRNVTVGVRSSVTPTAGWAIDVGRSTRTHVENCFVFRCYNGIRVYGANTSVITCNTVQTWAGKWGILLADKSGGETITGATQASPVVITCVDHHHQHGDIVAFTSVGGMTELNSGSYLVKDVTDDTFALYDPTTEAAIDGTGFSAYTSGGTVDHTSGSLQSSNTTLVSNRCFTTYLAKTSASISVGGISAISKGTSCTVTTASAHPYNTGDIIQFTATGAMTELTTTAYYKVRKLTSTTFVLVTPSTGVDLNSTSFTTYVSGASTARRNDSQPGTIALHIIGASTVFSHNLAITKAERGIRVEGSVISGARNRANFVDIAGCGIENAKIAYDIVDTSRSTFVNAACNTCGEDGDYANSGGWWIGSGDDLTYIDDNRGVGDLIMTNCRAINCRGNGFTVFKAATNTQMHECIAAWNSQPTAEYGNYDGLRVRADVKNLRIVGGQYGGAGVRVNNDSGTFTQRYGIYAEAGATTGLHIIGADLRGNLTGGFGSGALTGADNRIVGCTPTVVQTIASGSTTNVLGAYSDTVTVTGTATIASFGTRANERKFVTFSAAPTLTYNATTLRTPNGADMQVYAGQTLLVISDSSGNASVHDIGSVAVNAWTTLSSPDSADYIAAYDSSAQRLAKLPLGQLVGPSMSKTNLTISSGAITVTGPYHQVDTEGAAATDDLDTINGGTGNQILILRAQSNLRDVVVKNGANIRLAGGADFTMTHSNDTIMLIHDADSGVWMELSRSDNVA